MVMKCPVTKRPKRQPSTIRPATRPDILGDVLNFSTEKEAVTTNSR